MNLFNSFFKKKPLEKIVFITENSEDMASKHPDAFYDLYTSRKHGFLIKNFLKPEELESILRNYHKLEGKEVANTSVGYTYPMVFAEYSLRNNDCSEEEKNRRNQIFFEKNLNYPNEFIEDFGFDIKAKIDSFFKSISGNRNISTPKGVNNQGSYPFGNFRYLIPNGGGVSIHCGNFFQTRFEKFYAHLTQSVKVLNQMSFFIMLSKPQQGGELDIFNLRWENGQRKKDNLEDKEVIMPNGKVVCPDDETKFQKFKIMPEPGDMILFQGGNIWHRVDDIKGDKPRITFGGFIGFSHDEKTIFYWT